MGKKLYPPAYSGGVEAMLEPTTGFAWGIGSLPNLTRDQSGRMREILEMAAFLVIVGIVASVLCFLIYAYVRLYGNSHTSAIAVSVSLLFALFNIARATLQIAAFG